MKPLKLFRQEIFSPKNKTAKQLTGHAGEVAVANRYKADGYTVVARNLHVAKNELDLVVRNKTHIVFVEVKTRHAAAGVPSRYGRPADAVNRDKRAHTIAAAKAYLSVHAKDFDPPLQPRMDIAEVYMTRRDNGKDEITDIKIFQNAFGAR